VIFEGSTRSLEVAGSVAAECRLRDERQAFVQCSYHSRWDHRTLRRPELEQALGVMERHGAHW
jgi:hypothetical protein